MLRPGLFIPPPPPGMTRCCPLYSGLVWSQDGWEKSFPQKIRSQDRSARTEKHNIYANNILPFLFFVFSLGSHFPTPVPPELSSHFLFLLSHCMFCSSWNYWLRYITVSKAIPLSPSCSRYVHFFYFASPMKISRWSFPTLPTSSLVSSLTKSAGSLSPECKTGLASFLRARVQTPPQISMKSFSRAHGNFEEQNKVLETSINYY